MQNSTSPPVLLLTSAQAASALAIGERTLWALGASGAIRRVMIGRCVRYDPRDLVAYLESQKKGGDAR